MNDDKRKAADLRFKNAEDAVANLPADADQKLKAEALAELREAHRHVTRHARQAGAEAAKQDQAA